MCISASAALFLAALAALPSKGTDADNATKFTQNANSEEARPTINILYQMLHSTYLDIHNHTNSISNTLKFSNDNKSSFNSISNSKYSTTIVNDTTNNVNLGKDIIKNYDENEDIFRKSVNLSDTKIGAILDISDEKKARRKRVVSIVRTLEGANVTSVNIKAATVYLPTLPPYVAERRRRPGESGSSSPLLNYIFDTYSSSHQHRNDRAGGSNSIYAAAAPEVEALVGSTAHLDCKVDALHDKLVSWVRRKSADVPMDLLTTGTQLYTADERYSAKFIPPDIWRLEVRDVRPSDAAFYDCQLSAHPPRTARVTLYVPEVSVRIVDGAGAGVSEQVCEEGSTVALRCEVRGLRMEGGPALLWYRRDSLLNDDTTRGGISVRTEFGMNGANSVLRVARVRADDAGRYTCKVARALPVTLPPADVILHVIKGESLAELHQGAYSTSTSSGLLWANLLVVFAYLYNTLN